MIKAERIAQTINAMEENAPTSSPSSKALEVPMACEAQPIATPIACGCLILHSVKNGNPILAPIIPAKITIAAVKETIPLRCALISMAIGVVTDCPAKEAAVTKSAPNSGMM